MVAFCNKKAVALRNKKAVALRNKKAVALCNKKAVVLCIKMRCRTFQHFALLKNKLDVDVQRTGRSIDSC